jgi:hypothetical protein
MSENPTPEMEMTTPSVAEQAAPPVSQGNPLFDKAKNLKLVFGGLLGVVLVGLVGYWAYANYFMSPERMLKEAFEKMEVDSIKLGFEAEAEDVSIEGTIIAHEEKYSSMDFMIGLEEDGIKHEFELKFIADIDDVFFQMDYSYMEMLLAQADLMIPGISSTKTFELLQPVVTGKSWLHMVVPEEDQVDTTDPEEYAEEYKEFGEKLADAMVVKDFQRKTEYEGEKYNIISLGADKEKLLEAIDALKDLDIDAEVSDINDIKKAIEDMGELKETLLVVYIDMSGYVRIMDLYAPQGSSESIQGAIEEGAVEQQSPLKAQLAQLTTYFQPDKDAKEGDSVKFMTMTFDDYGSAEEVSEPSKTVEWDEVLLYAQSEFAPLFYQYMMMQQGAQQTAPSYGGMQQTYPSQAMPGDSGMPMQFMEMLNQ